MDVTIFPWAHRIFVSIKKLLYHRLYYKFGAQNLEILFKELL